MGKKKSVTFDVPSSPPTKVKKEKNIDSEIEARQKHINNLLETKKELENKIKMAAHKKKKPLIPTNVPPPLLEEVVCCVPLCSNTSFRTKSKMFFPFPAIKKLSKQWVQNVGRKGFEKKGADHLHENYKVCSDHFEPHMFVPKTKNKVLTTQAVPTIFESIHEPEISIHTGTAPPVKKPPKRVRKKKVILDEDFEYDEDLPLSSLLPPKLSMKRKLVKKTDATNKTKWMYKPSVQIVEDHDNDAVQSSGSEYEYEPCDLEDADPNDVNFDPSAPKRRKMGTRRKPKETLPLTLECYSDELSPAQKEAYATATQIYEECKKKLDELAKMKNAKLVFNNQEIQAYEIDEGATTGEIEIQEEYHPSMGVAGLPVSTSLTVVPPAQTAPVKRPGKQVTVLDKTKLSGTPVAGHSFKIKTLTAVKPQESTSIGGLFSKMNKSADAGGIPDSKEVTFNKLAGKTYPSLVVIARPSLKLKEIGTNVAVSERTALDAKVKAVLLYSSSNLTEWLIQQGLLRSEQYCNVHFISEDVPIKLKLGMYSDVTKFPHSGGYVWISECCPNKFVSVFYNSIFEGAPQTPSVLVKLMYHWACQTSIGNVTSWVKIDNLYLKTFYSYMRCVCTAAVHEKHELIGGPMKKVEVGVISLGTTNVDGNLRQVKVEVLGVFETDTTKIRLRAIEPLPESERNQKKRFAKIMEPLREWVHPDSAICTDFTVDKSAFLSLGFKNVFQVSLNDTNPPQMNNKNIMEYLRRVVPRMFQNTLSLLSRHIIQQFLDELVWRERFGPIPSRAFESIVKHLAEQTKLDTGGTLLNRYQKISVNPFANWKYANWAASCAQPVQEPKPLVIENRPVIQLDSALAAASEETAPQEAVVEEKRGRKRGPDRSPLRPSKKPASAAAFIEEGDTSLDIFYYGTLPGKQVIEPEYEIKYSCPTCSQIFSSNLLLLTHLEVHSVIPSADHHRDPNPAMCRYCLKTFTSSLTLNEHIDEVHIKKNVRTKCLICQERCREKQTLVKHMERSHNESELPYSCDYCSFRSSEHNLVVDHFYESHAKAPVLQCPFCLKVVVIGEHGDPIERNINFFLVHLERHQKKTARKCPRCVLTFANKMLIREHQLRDHSSQRGVPGLVPYADSGLVKIQPPDPPTNIPVPKLKLWLHFGSRFSALPCHECEVPLGLDDHIPGLFSCCHCAYVTSCVNAMNEHTKSFHGVMSKEPEYNVSRPTILSTRMYCVCGFNSHSGNKLARHTAMCKKISVYPTQESADSARVVIKPSGSSALNILGLVRKDSEGAGSTESAKLPGDSPNEEEEAESLKLLVEEVEDLETLASVTEEDALKADDEGEGEIEKDALQTTGEEDVLDKDNDESSGKPDASELDEDTVSGLNNNDNSNISFDNLDPDSNVGEESNDTDTAAARDDSSETARLVADGENASSGLGEEETEATGLAGGDEGGSLTAGDEAGSLTAGDEAGSLTAGDEASSLAAEDGEASSMPADEASLPGGDEATSLPADEGSLPTRDGTSAGEDKAEAAKGPEGDEDSIGDVIGSAIDSIEEEASNLDDNAEEIASAALDNAGSQSEDLVGGTTGEEADKVTEESVSTPSVTLEAPPTSTPEVPLSSAPITGSSAPIGEEDDDAELIKQDMAALQQDLAALSGTCDIPLNTILDRQMETTRAASQMEIMDTASPQPGSEEKMESQDTMDSGMEVEEGVGGVASETLAPPSSNTMECDSPSRSPGDNMLVE
ncbi:hypothetical protein M8J76_008664 [Diaphorina citri]|nr:hypothetical protein M8J76_008664 [Diaphorina citri]